MRQMVRFAGQSGRSPSLQQVRLQPCGVELRPVRHVQRVEREPLCKTLGAIILAELDTRLTGKVISGKRDIEDRQDLMPEATFMGIDILHENRRTEDLDRDPEFLAKLADDRRLCRLAEFDRAAKRAHAFYSSRVIQNLGGKKPVPTPVETERFQTDCRCRAPRCHAREIQNSATGGNWLKATAANTRPLRKHM